MSSSLSSSYSCPDGFDCVFRNSCPRFVVPCPDGFFCGTYGESEYIDEIDLGFATYKEFFGGGVDVTEDTYLRFIEPSRHIQSLCVKGFYCPNATSIIPCVENHFCPEASVGPNSCDSLSVAVPSELSFYEINFMNVLIMSILSIIVTSLSFYLIQSNKAREKKCKDIHNRRHNEREDVDAENKSKLAANSDTEETAIDNTTLHGKNVEGVELLISHCSYSYSGEDGNKLGFNNNAKVSSDSGKVLSDICAYFPAGSITAIMGPSGCGKTTLLNLIRARNGFSASRAMEDKDKDKGEFLMNIVRRSKDNSTSNDNNDCGKVESGGYTREPVTDLAEGSIIGFVPQEDIVDRALTVRELLMFNVRVRRNLTLAECERKVNEVLDILHLTTVADTIIGGGENAAATISGGQLKRVNIAVELVSLAEPSLLLLDEPTGGLDASVVLEIFDILQALSRKGTTIIMTLQQPRPEFFASVSLAMLMSMDGHMVYLGAPQGAAPFISSCGFKQPEDCSDADFCIDVLNSIIMHNSDNSNSNSNSSNSCNSTCDGSPVSREIELTSLSASSSRGLKNIETAAGIDRLKHLGMQRALEDKAWLDACNILRDQSKIDSSCNNRGVGEEVASLDWSIIMKNLDKFIITTQLSAWRSFLTRFRAYKTLIIYAGIHVLMAGSLSTGFTIIIMGTSLKTLFPPVRESLKGFYPSVLKYMANRNSFELGFQQLLFFMSSALGSASGLCAIQLFSGRGDIMKREASAGVNVFAAALGHFITDLLIIVWNASLFVGTWKLFGHPGHWYNWLISIAATSFASAGVGYICGVAVSSGQAGFTSLIVNMICCVFSGVEPKLVQVSHLPVLNWLWYSSFATWTAQSIYYTFTQYLTNEGRVPARLQDGASSYGYDISNLSLPILYLFLFGIITRIIASIIIYAKSR